MDKKEEGKRLVLMMPPQASDVAACIGMLDRCLSGLKHYALDPETDSIDLQTIKHHAEDCVGLGNKVLQLLKQREEAEKTGPSPDALTFSPNAVRQGYCGRFYREPLDAALVFCTKGARHPGDCDSDPDTRINIIKKG